MANIIPVARVSAIEGQAFAKGKNGELRVLHVGDVIFEGDVLVTAADGRVELAADDERTLVVSANETLTVDAEVLASVPPDATDSALQLANGDVNKVVKAINEGGSLDALLDETAAGDVGGSSDGGSTFVRLLRITEGVDSLGYEFDSTHRVTVDESNSVADSVLQTQAATQALTAELDLSSDSGRKGDGITNDNTPTISGTGDPGTRIDVTIPGTGERLTTTVGTDGKWSVTPNTPLPDGPIIISVIETDKVGNTIAADVPVRIDTTIAKPTVALTSDSAGPGGTTSDLISNDGHLTISAAASDVTRSYVIDGVASSDYDPAKLADGAHTVQVIDTDTAGNTASTDFGFTLDTTVATPTVSLLPSGFTSTYWGVEDAKISSLTNPLSEVLADLKNTAPTADFVTKTISFNAAAVEVFSNNLGSSGNLSKFIGSNATDLHLASNYGTTKQAIIEVTGLFTKAAGSYSLQVRADDGYEVFVDGKIVATVDKNQSPTTSFYNIVLAHTANDLHSIEVVYWDQGGQAVLQLALAPQGGTTYTPISSATDSNVVLTTVALDSVDQADLANAGVMHITSTAGTDLMLHLDSSQQMVDAAGTVYIYQNGVVYVPIPVVSLDHNVTVSATVIDAAGNASTTGTGSHIYGTTGADTINDTVGNDLLTGGLSSDVFHWDLAHQGSAGMPVKDTVLDFGSASKANGGDVLDLRDLLQGEHQTAGNTYNLTNFLHFEKNGGDTIVHISSTGGFNVAGTDTHNVGSSYSGGHEDQTIVLTGVDLTTAGTTDQVIIQDLLTKGKLVVDN